MGAVPLKAAKRSPGREPGDVAGEADDGGGIRPDVAIVGEPGPDALAMAVCTRGYDEPDAERPQGARRDGAEDGDIAVQRSDRRAAMIDEVGDPIADASIFDGSRVRISILFACMIPPKPAAFAAHLAPDSVEVKFVPFFEDRKRFDAPPRLLLVHTNAASGEGTVESAWNHTNAAPGTNTLPHYQVDRDGRARKMCPSDRRGIANGTVGDQNKMWKSLPADQQDDIKAHGNVQHWSLAIETADTGTEARPRDLGVHADPSRGRRPDHCVRIDRSRLPDQHAEHMARRRCRRAHRPGRVPVLDAFPREDLPGRQEEGTAPRCGHAPRP